MTIDRDLAMIVQVDRSQGGYHSSGSFESRVDTFIAKSLPPVVFTFDGIRAIWILIPQSFALDVKDQEPLFWLSAFHLSRVLPFGWNLELFG